MPLHVDERNAATHQYLAVLDELGNNNSVTLERTRTLDGDGLTERITVVNRSGREIAPHLEVALGTDLAGVAAIRSGAARALPDLSPTDLSPTDRNPTDRNPADLSSTDLSWESDGIRVTATFEPRSAERLTWTPKIPAGDEFTLVLRVSATFPPAEGFSIDPPATRPAYEQVSVDCDDHRIGRWVQRSLDDVAGLQLAAGGDAVSRRRPALVPDSLRS